MRVGETWRIYDSIECALRDQQISVAALYLPDYDSQALHRADSVWVVHGHFPTPMGGGYAACLTRHDADAMASTTQGSVARVAACVTAERMAAR